MIRSPRTRTPFWNVTAVVDPDGHGGDLAYTVGLAERGLPELHLWARPSLGDDPGEDWRFSNRDLGGILNESAWRLIDGDLRIGDVWTQEYDAGLVTVRFRLDAPQDAWSLEAYGDGESRVAPIRWSLERPPLGPVAPMTGEARRAAARELEWLSEVVGGDAVPLAIAQADWDPAQRFGPRTPIVEALAQAIERLEGDRLDALVCHLLDLHLVQAVSYPLVAARSAARSVGRVEHVCRAEGLGEVLGQGFGGAWGAASLEAILAPFGVVDRRDRAEVLDHLRPLIAAGLASFFATVVVADQLDSDQRLAGLGPVLGAFVARAAAPTPQWWAPAEVRDRLAAVLGRTDPVSLVWAAASWHERSSNALDGWGAILRVRATSSAAMAPEVSILLSAETAATVRRVCKANGVAWSLVQEWARDFCAILTLGEELPVAVRHAFVEASRPWLPHLGPLMEI